MKSRFFLMTCVALSLFGVAWAQFDPFLLTGGGEGESESANLFKVGGMSEFLTVTPGQEFHVALIAEISPDWVYYGPIPAGPAKGAKLDVSGKDIVVKKILWPATTIKPTDIGTGMVDMNVYKKHVVIYAALKISPDAKPGQITISLLPIGQLCKDSCIEVQPPFGKPIVAELKINIAGQAQANPAWTGDMKSGLAQAKTIEQLRSETDAVEKSKAEKASSTMGFWTALGVALLAGLVLNIMPCVLPVIPIRILSIVQLAGESRRRFVMMGLSFSAGMLLFFAAIAALNIVLKLTVGRGFDINEGFQTPAVIIVLAVIVVALAANLFGIFNVILPGRVMAMGQGVGESKVNPHIKSLGMGVMMAILATPCSFAFLAAAITYAQTATLVSGTLIILAIGLGMSAPHALLAAFPSLVDRLPRPGRWMELFKQSTGFVLLLVAVWLIGTLRGDGPSYPFWILAWTVIFVMSLWMWASWLRYDSPFRKKIIVRGIALILAVVSGWWMLTPPAEPLMKAAKFDWAQIQQARKDGRAVMIKFTAPWCTKCLEQDVTIFNKPEVAQAVSELGIYYVKADVSRASTPAAKWMHEQGYGVKIPMTLIFPPTGQALPPLGSEMTQDILIEKLKKAAGQS